MPVYTLFNQGAAGTLASDSQPYTMGVEFSVSQPGCTLTGIWWYSVSGATKLPATIALYAVSGTSLVTSQTPSWSGAAGSGWVRASFTSPPALTAGTNYKACVCSGTVTGNWYSSVASYWTTGGAGASGITSGPVTAPNTSGASPSQDSFNNSATLAYPGTASGNASNYWIDPEVTTAVPPGVPQARPGQTWLRRFHHRQAAVPAATPPLPPAGSVPPLTAVCRRLASQVSRAVTGGGARGVLAPFPPPSGQQPGGSVSRRRPARAAIASVIAAPILAHAVTGGTVAQRAPQQRHRAVTASIAGKAYPNGSRPGGTGVYRRAAARAVTGHAYGRAYPNGSKPGGIVSRRRPARAVTGHAAAPFRYGTPAAGSLVARRPHPRAAWAGTTVRTVNAVPVVTGPAGSQPGGLIVRRVPAGAVVGGLLAHPAQVSPAGSPPGGAVARRPAARGVAAGFVIATVNAAPAPPGGSPPGGVVSRRPRLARAVTAHGYGQARGVSPAGSLQPHPLVARRAPARAFWLGTTVSTVNATPTAPVPGSPPGGLIVRRVPSGAVLGGHASFAVPAAPVAGSVQPHPLVARRAPARARWLGTVVRTVNAAPAAPVSGSLQPAATRQPRRTAARAVIARLLAPFRYGVPVTGGLVSRRVPARAVTRSAAGRAFPAGQAPRGSVSRRNTARAVTGHAYGRPPFTLPAGTLQPHPAVSRRAPARALWAGTTVRTVNAHGPSGTVQPRATVPVPRRYPARAGAWQAAYGVPYARPLPGVQPYVTITQVNPWLVAIAQVSPWSVVVARVTTQPDGLRVAITQVGPWSVSLTPASPVRVVITRLS